MGEINKGLAFLVVASVVVTVCAACATKAQTGLAAGSGIGALMGQLIGRDTKGTLIGAGVGAGLGYIIGNEMDKSEAKSRETVKSEETQPLGGTTWQVVSMNPIPKEPFKTMTIRFDSNGTIVTTKTYANGTVKEDIEKYRIVGSTLIISDVDYIVNSRFKIDGNQMIMDTTDTSIVLKRI